MERGVSNISAALIHHKYGKNNGNEGQVRDQKNTRESKLDPVPSSGTAIVWNRHQLQKLTQTPFLVADEMPGLREHALHHRCRLIPLLMDAGAHERLLGARPGTMRGDDRADHRRQLENRLVQLNRGKIVQASAAVEVKSATPGYKSPRRPYAAVFPKYQNPAEPSETWSGRGKQPRWLVSALKAGGRIEDFRIPEAHHQGKARAHR